MKLGINQPYYLPYIGFFERVKACDFFIINPFTPLNRTRAFHRRVKIIQAHREAPLRYFYLTQSLSHDTEGKSFSKINLNDSFWQGQTCHVKTLYCTYKRAKFFDYLKRLLDLMLDREVDNLGKYNTRLTLKKLNYQLLNSSFGNKSTWVNFSICQSLGVDIHLAGQNGPLWLDETPFLANGIKVFYQKINFQPYPQFHRGNFFIQGLSIVDLIANHGPQAKDFLGQNSTFVTKEESLAIGKLTGR